jgi:hypothetical protein
VDEEENRTTRAEFLQRKEAGSVPGAERGRKRPELEVSEDVWLLLADALMTLERVRHALRLILEARWDVDRALEGGVSTWRSV